MEESKEYSGIDIIALVLKVLKEKKTLFKFVAVAAFVGLIVALETPKYYTSEVILAPELSSSGLGLKGNLAEMASSFGIDLGSKSSFDAIYPEIYPDIFSSTDFILSLFDVPVRLKDDNTTRTYVEHLKKDKKFPFWQYPQVWLSRMMAKQEAASKGNSFGEVDPYRISKIDDKLCLDISKSIVCMIDKKTSEITISMSDQDPMVAAIMVDTLQQRLQSYITEYRTKKARSDYDYYDKMVKEAEQNFTKSKNIYSSFSDAHRKSTLTTVNAQEKTLKDNMSNSYSSYSALVKMREQAQAKIQERTPAFTMIQNAKMPNKPSSRPRIITLLIFIFLGCIADTAWILYKMNFKKDPKDILTH